METPKDTSQSAKSILSYFKPPNSDIVQVGNETSDREDTYAITEDKDNHFENKPSKEVASPRKVFNVTDLSSRSKFTSFFCRPSATKSAKLTKTIDEQPDLAEKSPSPYGLGVNMSETYVENVVVVGSSPKSGEHYGSITIDLGSSAEESSPKSSQRSSTDSVVLVDVLPPKDTNKPLKRTFTALHTSDAPVSEPLLKQPTSPSKSSLSLDLSQMDPILQEAFLKRQNQIKSASLDKNNTEQPVHSVLFKIVPKVDPPRANPLFIRARVDDTFGMLKSKTAKELRLPEDILVFVYDGVALFDTSKPSSLDLLGSQKRVSNKEKAIEIFVYTKSTWHMEREFRNQQRQTFMENVQFLNQQSTTDTGIEDELPEAESVFSQPHTQSRQLEMISISIRTNKTGLQIFNVQVPKFGKIVEIVEQLSNKVDLGIPLENVKVKFDGDLLELDSDISAALEHEDMVELTL